MRIIGSFTRELTLAAIDGLAKYYEIVESKIQTAKEEERVHIREKIKSMRLDLEGELVEWDIARQEHEMTFDMLLPNYFRYSCMVLLYLVVENKLKEFCEVAQSVKNNLPPPPQPKHGIVNEYKKYLSNTVGLFSKRWDAVRDLNKIRNCIVHASGKVKDSSDKEYLRRLANSEKGIIINGTREQLREDLRPLYLEDDMLMLKPEYCREIIQKMRDLFEELCDALSLSKLAIEESPDSTP